MLHVRDIVELGPCFDSARTFKAKRVISDENFFLNTKSSLFSLLRIVHINLAYQNVIPLPNVNYVWFYVSKIKFYIKHMLYKMRSIVTLITPKTRSTDIL